MLDATNAHACGYAMRHWGMSPLSDQPTKNLPPKNWRGMSVESRKHWFEAQFAHIIDATWSWSLKPRPTPPPPKFVCAKGCGKTYKAQKWLEKHEPNCVYDGPPRPSQVSADINWWSPPMTYSLDVNCSLSVVREEFRRGGHGAAYDVQFKQRISECPTMDSIANVKHSLRSITIVAELSPSITSLTKGRCGKCSQWRQRR